MTTSSLLVRHLQGDVLIDRSNSSHFDQEAAEFPFLMPQIMRACAGTSEEPDFSASCIARDTGIGPTSIRLQLPSHTHLDQRGVYEDLPRILVLTNDAQRKYLYDPTARSIGRSYQSKRNWFWMAERDRCSSKPENAPHLTAPAIMNARTRKDRFEEALLSMAAIV
jgi:hypothetical protein